MTWKFREPLLEKEAYKNEPKKFKEYILGI